MGYRTELIQSATTYSLGGQVELKYALGGECPSPELKGGHVQKTVLIVEDEFLIAMDLKLMLEAAAGGSSARRRQCRMRSAC
jgi:hypothetical protein